MDSVTCYGNSSIQAKYNALSQNVKYAPIKGNTGLTADDRTTYHTKKADVGSRIQLSPKAKYIPGYSTKLKRKSVDTNPPTDSMTPDTSTHLNKI